MTKNHGEKKKVREFMKEHGVSYMVAMRLMKEQGLIPKSRSERSREGKSNG